MAQGKKVHYAWFVLAGCCILTFGMGALLNTGGQWFVAVTQELGVGVAQLSLYFTISGLCMAFTAPVVGKVLPKVNVRVLLTVCYLLVIVAVLAMSQYTAVWMWYISGAVLGIAGSFCFIIPVPVILGQWFAKKNGFAVGLAMAFSGVGGALFNPLAAALIPMLGWRTAYIAVALIAAVIILPFTIFVIRFSPAEMGLKPYGYEEAGQEQKAGASAAQGIDVSGVSAKKAYRSPAFWMLFVAVGFSSFLAAYSQILPSFAASIGLTGIVGLISTVFMVALMIWKLSMGGVSDKIGPVATTLVCAVASIAGFALVVFAGTNAIVVLAGCALIGSVGVLATVLPPLLSRAAFGAKDFTAIYATLSVGMNLIGAFGTPIIGLVYDSTGSYVPALWMGAGMCAVIALLAAGGVNIAKRIPREA